MEIAFWILPALLNCFFWWMMRIIQSEDSKRGRILPRSKEFLYMQDFRTNGLLGDVFGLSLLDTAVLVLMYRMSSQPLLLILLIFAAASIAIVVRNDFDKACRSREHKPDWGYPSRDVISWGGRLHLLYLTIQVGICASGVIMILSAVLDQNFLPLIIGFVGAGIYGWAFWLDKQAGRLVW